MTDQATRREMDAQLVGDSALEWLALSKDNYETDEAFEQDRQAVKRFVAEYSIAISLLQRLSGSCGTLIDWHGNGEPDGALDDERKDLSDAQAFLENKPTYGVHPPFDLPLSLGPAPSNELAHGEQYVFDGNERVLARFAALTTHPAGIEAAMWFVGQANRHGVHDPAEDNYPADAVIWTERIEGLDPEGRHEALRAHAEASRVTDVEGPVSLEYYPDIAAAIKHPAKAHIAAAELWESVELMRPGHTARHRFLKQAERATGLANAGTMASPNIAAFEATAAAILAASMDLPAEAAAAHRRAAAAYTQTDLEIDLEKRVDAALEGLTAKSLVAEVEEPLVVLVDDCPSKAEIEAWNAPPEQKDLLRALAARLRHVAERYHEMAGNSHSDSFETCPNYACMESRATLGLADPPPTKVEFEAPAIGSQREGVHGPAPPLEVHRLQKMCGCEPGSPCFLHAELNK